MSSIWCFPGRELDSAGLRLQQTANLVADHTSRALDAVDIVLRDMAAERQGASATGIPGMPVVAGNSFPVITQSLFPTGSLWILDQQGELQHASSVFPVPQINEKDQPFFRPWLMAPPSSPMGLSSAAIRIATVSESPADWSTPGPIRGNRSSAARTRLLHRFLLGQSVSRRFRAILVNSRHQMLASCRPVDPTQQASFLGSDAVADSGWQGLSAGNWPELSDQRDRLPDCRCRTAQLPGTAGHRIASRNDGTSPWSRRALELGIFAGLATAVLPGGWLVRRQVAEQSQPTAALDENRRELEERIREATAELAFKKEEAERASTARAVSSPQRATTSRQPLHALSLFAADLQRQVKSGTPADWKGFGTNRRQYQRSRRIV